MYAMNLSATGFCVSVYMCECMCTHAHVYMYIYIPAFLRQEAQDVYCVHTHAHVYMCIYIPAFLLRSKGREELRIKE